LGRKIQAWDKIQGETETGVSKRREYVLKGVWKGVLEA